jgi:hypothetical protein
VALKDFITLVLSSSAVILSIVTFYLQRIRKKDRLIGRLVRHEAIVGTNYDDEVSPSRVQYSVSNIGDTQLVLTNARITEGTFTCESKTNGIPCVLKPNDITLLEAFYENAKATSFRFDVIGSQGKAYEVQVDLKSFDSFSLGKPV